MNSEEIIEISRENVEKDITFLGFLICENKLKQESSQVIQELNEAKINSLMVTGDNPLTAISVGRGCKMIEENHEVFLFEKDQIKKTDFQLRNISISKINPPTLERINLDNIEVLLDFIETLDEKNCFAVTGESFEFLYDLLNKERPYERKIRQFLTRTVIFSRMKPHNKSQLILFLREEDHFVMMTGGLI